MKLLKDGIAGVLVLLSAFMLFSGASIFLDTSGEVQGSEFGMLITLANQVSLIMLWLAVFGLWRMFPESCSSKEDEI